MKKIEIKIENVLNGYRWRLYTSNLDRPACEGYMTFPSYSTCVEDAKHFRKNFVDSVPIIYHTPKKSKRKVI